MININEIRKKYPQYDSLSDKDLADKLHAKYYPQLEKEDFYNRIGMSKNNNEINNNAIEKSFSDRLIGNDPLLNVKPQNPINLVYDIATGLGKAGQGIASTLTGGYAPTVNFDELNPNKNQDFRNKIAQGIAQYAPFGMAGGARLLPSVGQGVKSFLANPGQLLAGLGFGSTQTEPDEKIAGGYLPSGKLGGALESALINLFTHGAAKGLEALRPSKILRGNLSPEELKRNLEITKGTETGLGDVIGSPFLKKRLENTLTLLPFSGANEALQRTGKEVVTRGENILSEMLGNGNPENIPEEITKDLLDQFKKQRQIKNDIYNEFNDEAQKQFIDMRLPRFAETAKKYKDALASTNILKYEPGVKSILSKLGVYESPIEKIPGNPNLVNEAGQPLLGESLTTFKLPTATEATFLKGKLNDYKNMHKTSPQTEDRFLTKMYGDLHSAIKEDIKEAVEQNGNPKLKETFNRAEENYRKNFSKFLDKEIYKYIGGNKNPENIITDFIKTSPNADLASRITKISNTLTPATKERLAYAYFSRALDNEGNLNPAKMGTAIEKLKPNQFKALVPDKNLRKKLKDYSKLQHMNKEAQNLMFNPHTGQRTTDVLITGLLGLMGQLGTGNIGALMAPTATILGGKMMTKALTNEKLREMLVKKMINNKPLFATPAKITGAQSLSQGLLSALGK